MKKKRKVAPLAATLITFGSLVGGANGAIIADSVQGSLVNLAGIFNTSVTTNFVSPSTVGPGIEFSGVWEHAGISQSWQVNVDIIDETQFTVSFQETNELNNLSNISMGGNHIGIELSDLDFNAPISNITLNNIVGGGNVSAIRFTDTTIDIDWDALDEDGNPSNVFTFDVTTGATAIPEPSSALFLGIGLLGLVARRKRAT